MAILTLLSLCLAISTSFCFPQPNNSDLRRKFAETLEKCSEIEWPFFNETISDYICAPILVQGPCKNGEWLIIDADGSLAEAKCVKLPCDGRQKMVELVDNGQCAKIRDTSACGQGMQVLPNPFGKGT